MRIERREQNRCGTKVSIYAFYRLILPSRFRLDALRLTGFFVKSGNFPAVDQIRIQRIHRNVPVFLCTDRAPIPKRDLSVIASRGDHRRSAFLLPSIHVVWKLIVCAYVIKLCRRLIVPGRKRLPSVDCYDSSLIRSKDHDVGLQRINPDSMVVISARRASNTKPGFTAVGRFPGGHIRDENNIRIIRVDTDFTKVITASPETMIVG